MSAQAGHNHWSPITSKLSALWSATHQAVGLLVYHLMRTEFRNLPGNGPIHAWRVFVWMALQPWYRGCGWYQWCQLTEDNQCIWRPAGGPARWFWRKPKNRHWAFAEFYTIGDYLFQ